MPPTFIFFKDNPEEFSIKAARVINEEKAAAIIQHITYDILEDYDDETEIFTEPAIKGKLGVNAMKAKKHLYDHIVYDSIYKRDFAELLDADISVAVYVKLPVIAGFGKKIGKSIEYKIYFSLSVDK